MNKEYIYIDDKVEVKNEFDEVKKIDCSDNIEEILIKENVIEQMELEHKKLLNEKKHNKNISFKMLKKSIFILLIIPILLIITPLITGITELVSLPIIGCICAIGIPLYLSLFLIYEYNKIDRINKGIDISLSYLENQLNFEKENLKKLNENKKVKYKIINVPVSKRVDDISQLKKLKDTLLIYYNCGLYSNKYQKYLMKGKLKNKLSKTFNEEQIILVEEY